MLKKWLEFGLTGDQEDRFRQAHLQADLAQTRIGIWLIAIPFVIFLYSDYQFFGWSRWFYVLTTMRLGFLAYTFWFLNYLRGAKDYRSYDRTELLWGLTIVSFTMVVNLSRPQFIGHVVVIIVAVFITLLIILNKFINQILLSLAFVIGEALIITPNLRASAVQTAFSILLSLFLATAVGISSSRQLHSWRRREFLAREEEQRLLNEVTRAEQKLRRNREWLRVTLISIGDAVISTDTAGKITFLNPVAQTLTGWQPKEALGQPIQNVFRIINEKTLEPGEDIVRRVLQEGSVVSLSNNMALISRAGQTIPVEDSAAPIKDRDGRITGAVLVFHDVSEKRRAQEAIREGYVRLCSVLENITDAYFAYDDEWHFIDVNPEAEKVLGSKASRLIGQRIFDLYPQTEHSEPFRHYRKAVEERKPVHFEARSPISGDWYEFHAYPRSGRLEVYLKNINERKQAEEALLRAKEDWERTFDTVPDLVAILDDQHKILRVNRAMADRLGTTPRQCIGLHCYEVVHGMAEPPGICPHKLTCRDGHEHIAELHEPRLNGHFLVSTSPLFNPQGKLVGAVHVARDITERKEAEDLLRKSHDELEMRVEMRTADLAKANEALRRLSSRLLSTQEEERKRIAGEIHDTIGAGLSAIKFKIEETLNRIDRAGAAPDVTDSLRTIIPVVRESIEECRRIQQDLRPSILDDLGLLATVSWFCRRFQSIYSHIQVDQEIGIKEEEIPEALKIVIYRITQEAMNNLAKYSRATRVYLSLRKLDGYLEFVVRDNGKGFDPDKVLSQENARKGLGLTSMRERAELSGGSLAIKSAEGEGTTIRAEWKI
jgi:PAS domain S-box-containing protein